MFTQVDSIITGFKHFYYIFRELSFNFTQNLRFRVKTLNSQQTGMVASPSHESKRKFRGRSRKAARLFSILHICGRSVGGHGNNAFLGVFLETLGSTLGPIGADVDEPSELHKRMLNSMAFTVTTFTMTTFA